MNYVSGQRVIIRNMRYPFQEMAVFVGRIATITDVHKTCYSLDLDAGKWAWSDSMLCAENSRHGRQKPNPYL